MFSCITSGTVCGLTSFLIRVEVDMSPGLPCLVMVGRLSSEVKESGERVRVALKNSGFQLPPLHIAVNLSPADIRKSGTAFDLPLALAILSALGKIPEDALTKTLVLGELGLNGEIKEVTGVLPILWEAFKKGYEHAVIPDGNRAEGLLVEGMFVGAFKNLRDIIEILRKDKREMANFFVKNSTPPLEKKEDFPEERMDFSQVRGQEQLKRGAVIAAAGFHHMLLVGPPGSGKTMIASRLPTIMPELSFEESMEITSIYSIAGELKKEEPLIVKRPFLSPHHTCSTYALAGGGRVPKPGYVSLAHRGVLFLDELPEFGRQTIDLLRQPLEEKVIHLVRTTGTYHYPADFQLLAAMNPCPCGFYPNTQKCSCTPSQIHKYAGNISGPILDRIDLCLTARKLEVEALQGPSVGLSSAQMREMVSKARNFQQKRYEGKGVRFNSELRDKELEMYCTLDAKEKRFMEKMYEKCNLTARSYHKLLRVARTIADLDESENIKQEHLAEAICYRPYGGNLYE